MPIDDDRVKCAECRFHSVVRYTRNMKNLDGSDRKITGARGHCAVGGTPHPGLPIRCGKFEGRL